MSLIGGYLGAHAILLRGGNFGSAQTGNFIELMIDISEMNWQDFGIRLIAAALFALALILSTVLEQKNIVAMKPVTIVVEAVGVTVAALLPRDMNAVIALYPIFFISAFQWSTFGGAEGYSSSTIFSTNNFRQSVTGWALYLLTKEERSRHIAVFYTQTVVCFLLGAFIGGALSLRFGPKGLFFCLVPLATALTLVYQEEQQATGAEE